MFTVIVQLRPQKSKPFITKNLSVRLNKTDATTLALELADDLRKIISNTGGIRIMLFENRYLITANKVIKVAYVVYAGSNIIGILSVVKIAR